MTTAPPAITGHSGSYDIQIVDTLPLVEACVSDLCSCPAGIPFGLRAKPRIDTKVAQVEVDSDAQCTYDLQPCVAVDLEGVRLSRMGKVSLVQLKANHSRKVWLVDVTVLGKEAFTHSNVEGASLKAVLESPVYKKLFYDVRRDADALYNLYNITLQNVLDVQLLELSVRISNHIHSCHLNGFAKAIALYLQPQSPSPFLWTKELGKALMQPHALVRVRYPGGSSTGDSGAGVVITGSHDVFEKRPLPLELVEYAAQDVALLAPLEEVLVGRVRQQAWVHIVWDTRVRDASMRRVAESRDPFDPDGPHRAFSPWM